ncbi:MAG: class II aldolase/adducin family protein [Acidimicrobiales bacterium]
MTATAGLIALGDQLIATATAMEQKGINNGMAGNVSVRVDGGMLITPSGVPYDRMGAGDVINMSFDTSWAPLAPANEHLRPSSEWRFHLDILRSRPEANAVVHAHPTAAAALSAHGRGIGPFHYMVGVAGGHDIRCAEYATFGTAELSANVLAALEGRTACLLAHHGILAIAADLPSALAVAVEVEVLAAQYLAALAIGEPPQLSEAQMDEVLAKMASPDGYGSSPDSDLG